MLFLWSEVTSPLLATEMTVPADAPWLITAATLEPAGIDAFESHQLELGRLNTEAIRFGDDEPSPLFTGRSEVNPNASDWDYLWQNASRIPITSIPEPTIGSLVIGGAVLLCGRRMHKTK